VATTDAHPSAGDGELPVVQPTKFALVVDPNEHSRVGSMQYPETLPLNDHEVVLTFDDGPVPRHKSSTPSHRNV